jgi:aryl-alcohol dehydrogenase-like predicted oxidoreductase
MYASYSQNLFYKTQKYISFTQKDSKMHYKNMMRLPVSIYVLHILNFIAILPTSKSWTLSSTNTNANNNNQPVAKRVKANNIYISEMGCGTWSWGNRLLFDYNPDQDEDIYESYKYVRDAGISVFDTADSYGTLDLNGRAEILLGKFERRFLEEKTIKGKEKGDGRGGLGRIFAKEPIIQTQQVATKFAPYPWRITPNQMVEAAKSSLKRLDQDKLAIAQLHWSTANYQPFQEKALWEGIGDVYDAGLCDAVGVSNYGPQQLQKISEYMIGREVPIATAQIQYSLMTYKDCKDMNECCDENGCRLISYSPLCLGVSNLSLCIYYMSTCQQFQFTIIHIFFIYIYIFLIVTLHIALCFHTTIHSY